MIPHSLESSMRVLVLTSALATMALAAPLAAQQPTSVQQEIRLTRDEINRDRQAIVKAALPLDATESAKFWPIYDEYKMEQKKIGDRSWKALTGFAENYDGLGDATSKTVLDDWLGAREDQAKLAKKWRGKFVKAIGEKKTLRFYQIEAKLDQAIQGEVIQAIPLAR
jgi:hypothetical protein